MLPVPAGFNKTAPANSATGVTTNPTLSWGTSSGAASYAYCYDTTNDNACSVWTSAGTSTSVGLSGLTPGTTYYWQVRATNASGTTHANGSATAFWSFAVLPVPRRVQQDRAGQRRDERHHEPDAVVGHQQRRGELRVLLRHDQRQRLQQLDERGHQHQCRPVGVDPGHHLLLARPCHRRRGTTYANGSATAFWSFTVLPGGCRVQQDGAGQRCHGRGDQPHPVGGRAPAPRPTRTVTTRPTTTPAASGRAPAPAPVSAWRR